jgi:hypothetical protein
MRFVSKWIRAMAVSIVTIPSISCGARVTSAACRNGDATKSLSPEVSSQMLDAFGAWVQHVRECQVGDYVIYTPAEGGSGQILVGRRQLPVFYSDASTTTLMDASGKRIVFSSTKSARPSESTFISYATYDPVQKVWVENVDVAGDGSIDFRRIETPGLPVKTEYSVDQRWLELVQRGSLSGVILDGEFMTPAVAREKLAATRKSVR